MKNYNPDINIIQDYRITNPDFRSSEIKQTQEFRHTNSDYKPEDRSRNNLNNELASKEYRLNYSDSTNIEDKNFKNNRNSKFSKEEVKDYKVEVTSPYKPLKEEPRNPKFDYNFDKRANDELYKEENRGFWGEKNFSERIDQGKSEQAKEENIADYRKTMQNFKYKEETIESQNFKESPRPYNEYLSKYRNYSTEPTITKSSKNSAISSTRPYKEDLIYSSRNYSAALKENSPRPGILKHSSVENSRVRDSPQINNTAPLISPREASGVFSRTLKDNSLPEKYEEEMTEKPSSILKNNWIEKDYNPRSSRYDNIEKKVNFSDSVYHIEDSNTDQMPEIKLAEMKIIENKKTRPDYRAEDFRYSNDYRLGNNYKSSELKTSNYIEDKNRYNATQSDTHLVNTSNCWPCPKCNLGISNNFYECTNCRFINWDKFYTLKSKTPKLRSESIPVVSEREDSRQTFGVKRDDRYDDRFDAKNSPNKETWKIREIKYSNGPDHYPMDEHARRSTKDFAYNR